MIWLFVKACASVKDAQAFFLSVFGGLPLIKSFLCGCALGIIRAQGL